MRMKRCAALILSVSMVMAGLPYSAVMAAEAADMNPEAQGSQKEFRYVEQVQETEDILEDLPDNDELFAAYVDGLFFGEPSVSVYAEQGAKKLQGLDLKAYELLKDKIHKIAMGEEESSRITISLEELGITKRVWTAEELGVESVVTGNAISQEAMNILSGRITPDLRSVLNYLLADCPWDLYWYDKTAPTASSQRSFQAFYENGVWLLSLAENFTGYTYDFPVAAEYRDSPDDPYVLNAALVRTAGTAAENAKQIVEENAGLNDLEKMTAYKDKICELVSYNNDALGPNVAYGNPWQLIWVFDEDPDTEVVCEGYSKAFQYLCDMSVFRSRNTACYTVTGVMDGGTGAGRHMWNIATMGNQKNYIVDVTNCDTGSVGTPDKLFLTGASGSVSGGYTVSIPGYGQEIPIHYSYDSTMPAMYGDILEISEADYEYDASHEENCPNHHLIFVAEKPAACTENGNIAYYTCQACRRVFRDENETDEIRLEDTVLQAPGHNYGEIYESDGTYHWKECEVCGEAGEKENHQYGGWTVKEEGSCTKQETEARTCGTCGYEETRETGKRHDLQKTEAKEPTCTEAGNLEYWSCKNCGQAFEDGEGKIAAEQKDFVIAASGHQYGTEWDSDETGHYHTCSKCSGKSDEAEHTFRWITDREPTETSAGLRHEECTVCQYRGKEETIENPPQHEHRYGEAYETDENGHWKICETCGEASEAEGHRYGDNYASDESDHWKECEVCKKAGEKENHHYEDWTVKAEGSCTEQEIEARTCGTCGYEQTREAGLRHDLQKTEAKDATCTEAGNLEYWSCKNCGQAFEDGEGKIAAEQEDFVIAAAGHQYGTEWDSDETGHYHTCSQCSGKSDEAEHTFRWITDREPTETSAGLRHEECTVCRYRGKEETIEKPAEHEHRYGEAYESDENGHFRICEICGEASEAEEHRYGDDYVSDESGHWKECEVCKKASEAEGHTYGVIYETDETGHWTECEVCKKASEAEEHTYGDSYETDGISHWKECEVCGTSSEAGEHRYGEAYISDGVSHWKECEVCGKASEAGEHVYGVIYASDETGHWIECEVCKSAAETEPHDYGNWTVITEGSCTEPGREARTCGACGFEEIREIAAGHTLEKTEAKEPTCTEAGNLEYWSCKNCGQVFEDEAGENAAERDTFEIAAAGHRFGEWIIDTLPTCTQDGRHHRICSICDEIQAGAIAASGHDWDSYRIDLPATCTAEGSRSRRCRSCGEISREAISAVGHSMVKTEAKEATCTADGNAEYYTCLACKKKFLDAKGEREVNGTEGIEITRVPHQYEYTVIPATTERDGSIYGICKACGSVAETKAIECPRTVTLSYKTCVYNGQAKRPSVTVSDRKGNIISAENYDVSYSQNKNVGTAKVQITFKGDYSGTVTRTFAIRTKGTSVSRLKAVAKGFTVTWKKNKKQTTGYQIQYAENKKFKGAKTKTYEGTAKATILKLKAKKRYYVRIRTYKTVDGVRIYSGWSGAKSVKTKK